LRSTLQRTFAVLQGLCPVAAAAPWRSPLRRPDAPSNGVSSNAWPVLSATAVDYVLLKNAPSPLSTPTGTAGRSSKRPLLRISTTTTAESNEN